MLGEDYPTFSGLQETSFLCDEKIPGYYADPEGECQQYYVCADGKSASSTMSALMVRVPAVLCLC